MAKEKTFPAGLQSLRLVAVQRNEQKIAEILPRDYDRAESHFN